MSNISETNLKKRKLEDLEVSSDFFNELITNDKIDFSKIENLSKFKDYLYQKESEYSRKIAQIKTFLKETNRNIAKRCEKKNKNHKWIRERENCMYGSTFTLCEHCKVDFYDRTYMHY